MSLFPSRLTIPFSLFWLVFILIAFSDAAVPYLIAALTICVLGLWGGKLARSRRRNASRLFHFSFSAGAIETYKILDTTFSKH